MKIIIAGGTGFLGSALVRHLTSAEHELVILTRRASFSPAPRVTYVKWTADGQTGPWARAVEGANAIINLAGESIAARRWTAAQKDKIRKSRVLATQSIVNAIRGAAKRLPVLVNASAVGYYGNRGGEQITESSAPGRDFLAEVCQEWEDAAKNTADVTRVAFVRTGIVLDRKDGALAKLVPPFRLFAGGPIGSGEQYMPWIHKKDWVRLVDWMLQTQAATGPFNATAPNPVTNAEFSKALGQALHRPSWLPIPAVALRLGLGEMADALLLGGQRALPVRSRDLGFTFEFTEIGAALADIFQPGRAGP